MKSNITNKKDLIKYYILLLAIIVVQIVYLCTMFVQKDGHHSDEVYNYGFANSYYENDYLSTSYLNNWTDSSIAKGFLTVGKNQRFAYKSVFDNTVSELNPPFQIFVLHTLCSFFPEKFSWNFCFAINIFSFIVTQFFLFALSRKITGNILVPFATVILYGFGVGAMDIAIFMRIYALAVMFSVIFAYYSHKIYENRNSKNYFYDYLILFISCLLGCYTLHLFLFYAFCITACYSIFFLFSKKFKKLFAHGFTILGAALLSIILVPSTVSHIEGTDGLSVGLIKYPTTMQVRLYFYLLTKDLFGLHVSAFPNPYLEYCLIGLFVVAVLSIPLFFLFRKEDWFKHFLNSLNEWFIDRIKRIKNIQFSLIVYFITCIAVVILDSDQTSIYTMGVYSNRYLFIIYPAVVLFCISTLYILIRLINDKRTFKNTVAVIVLIFSFVFAVWSQLLPNSSDYLFIHKKEGVSFDKIETGSNVVIMLGQDWKIVCFAPDLINTDSYFFTDFGGFKDNENIFDYVDRTKPMYLIIDTMFILPDDVSKSDLKGDPIYDAWTSLTYYEKELIDYYSSMNNVDDIKMVGKDQQMSTNFNIYKVSFKD